MNGNVLPNINNTTSISFLIQEISQKKKVWNWCLIYTDTYT